MRFENKTVFITGAGSGIGRATAIQCAREDAYVVVTDIVEEGAIETAEEIEDLEGGRAEARRLDVTEGDAFADQVEEIDEDVGLDVIVNNAGLSHPPQLVEDIGASIRDYVIDVNIKGAWNGCHAALPIMKDQGHGAIVNVGSLASVIGVPQQTLYSLTKGAVLNFTRAVAAEAGPHGVRANAVCPGYTDTALVRTMLESFDDPEAMRSRLEGAYPLNRFAEANEIASAITFLASDDASFITGEGLLVDGGFRATGGS